MDIISQITIIISPNIVSLTLKIETQDINIIIIGICTLVVSTVDTGDNDSLRASINYVT